MVYFKNSTPYFLQPISSLFFLLMIPVGIDKYIYTKKQELNYGNEIEKRS